MGRYFLSAVALAVTLNAAAQDKIETDRPDQTENATLVAAGHFQLESGMRHEQVEYSSSDVFLPAVLIKYGLSSWLELRLETDFALEGNSGGSYGLLPVIAGAKAKIAAERGFLPETSAILQLKFPKLSGREHAVSHLAPEIRMVMKNKIAPKISLGYNFGISWDGEDTRPEHFYTVSPSLEITDRIKVFAETYGFSKPSRHAEIWFDGGLSFLVTDALQLDLSAGYEATHTGGFHDFFESMGFSFRI